MIPWESRYDSWEGTAAELASAVTRIAEELNLGSDEVVPNERLVRNYVQQGILERPERRGKEAFFGFRQIVEFLAARNLIRDGWPLAKIAEFNRSSGLTELLEVLPRGRERNRAQELVSKYRRLSTLDSAADHLEMSAPSPSFLERSAEITKGRISKRDALEALGNPSVSPERDSLVRLTLAPWCHVYFDPEVFRRMPPDAAEQVGEALTQCLMDERIRPGEKK